MNISRPIVRVHINCHVTCHAPLAERLYSAPVYATSQIKHTGAPCVGCSRDMLAYRV